MTNGNAMKDGSVTFFEREIGQITVEAGRTGRFYLKNQPNMMAYLKLELDLLYHSVAVVPQAPRAYAPFSFIRNLQVKGSNSVLLKGLPGLLLSQLNSYEFYAEPRNDIPADLQGADTAIHADLFIPFSDHTIFNPERTILNTNSYSELELQLTFGDITDFSFVTGITDTITGQINIVACERQPFNLADQQQRRQRMVDSYQIKDAHTLAPVIFDLPENTLNKTFMFLAWGDIDGTEKAPVDGILDRIRIYDDNMQRVLRDLSATQIQSLNTQQYHLENGNDIGVHVIEFGMVGGQPVRPADYSSLYNSIGRNYPQAELTFVQGDEWVSLEAWLLQRQIVTPGSVSP